VSASSAIRWWSLKREQGDVLPGPLGGDRRSGHIESHAALILALVEHKPDVTLEDLRQALSEQGVAVSPSALWRFFERRQITLKKSRRTRTSKAVPM